MSGVFHRSAITVGNVKNDIGIHIENRTFEISQLATATVPWIKYGSDNRHPQFLLELAHKSGLHFAILQTKANMVLGDGLEIEGDESLVKEANEFLETIGLDENALDGIAWDMTLFGGSYAHLGYGFNREVKRDLKKIHKLRSEEFRLGKPEKMESGIHNLTKGFLHKDWKNPWRPTADSEKDVASSSRYAKEVKLWFREDDNDFKDVDKKDQTNLIYRIRRNIPLLKYYPVPDYQSESGLNSILLDSELVSFDISELENGMTAQYLVTFIRKDFSKVDPEKETELREQEEATVRDSMKGTENAARIVIARAEPPAPGQDLKKPIDITEIPTTNTEGRHKIMTERKNVGILVAHGVPTPEIASIPNLSKTGFSSQSEKLLAATKLMFGFRILPLRKPIIKFVWDLLKEKDDKFKDLDNIKFKDRVSLTETISDEMWQHAFEENEFRTSRGYKELDETELQTLRDNRPEKKASKEQEEDNKNESKKEDGDGK